MSDTPRTDAILALQPNNGFGLDKGQCICQWHDHASQLERELSTAQAQIAVANKALALENEISAFMSESTISFKEWLKRNATLLQARDQELAEKDAQIATLEAKRMEDVRMCEELCSYYSSRQAIRAAFPEIFNDR